MKNASFLIWCVSVLLITTIGQYFSFISGYTIWEQNYYDSDTIGISALAELIIFIGIGYLLYEGKE